MAILSTVYADGSALWSAMPDIDAEVWPEYNRHGDVMNRYWGRLEDEFPEFQFMLYDDESGEVVALGNTAACVWNGSDDGLAEGIDDALAAAFDARAQGRQPTALCALAAQIRPQFQGQGLAVRMLQEMAALARGHGLSHLIAPVRPSFKERYPLAPIERYIHWTRDDGTPFDPWLRTHVRLGGRIVSGLARSLRITGTVAEWEQWTAMRFPDDGEYTFPHGLAPVTIDRAGDRGSYWEPNVWVVHDLRGVTNDPNR
jgi:GNAT superfamily N-acetyltransferase